MSSLDLTNFFHVEFCRRPGVEKIVPEGEDFDAFKQRYIISFSEEYQSMEITACTLSNDVELEKETLFALMQESNLIEDWVQTTDAVVNKSPIPKWGYSALIHGVQDKKYGKGDGKGWQMKGDDPRRIGYYSKQDVYGA